MMAAFMVAACGDTEFSYDLHLPVDSEVAPTTNMVTSFVMGGQLTRIFGANDTLKDQIRTGIIANKESFGGACDPYRLYSYRDCLNSKGATNLGLTQGTLTPPSGVPRMGYTQKMCHTLLNSDAALLQAVSSALGASVNYLVAPSDANVRKMMELFYPARAPEIPEGVVSAFGDIGRSVRANRTYCSSASCYEPYRYVLLAFCVSPYWQVAH